MGVAAAEAEAHAAVQFAREPMATVVGEIDHLMREHWEEVGFYRDMPIDPDFAKYAGFERNGILRIYTARAAERLVGYAIYLLGTALHYQTVLTAQQSTLFVHPRFRAGMAAVRFFAYQEAELEREGVQLIAQHVKVTRDFRPLLTRRGYELQDWVMTKRLGAH